MQLGAACFAIALFIGAVSPRAEASVWAITSEWDIAKEDKFGSWLAGVTNQPANSEGKTQSILFEPGQPLNGIPVDCADFVYATRIIFAAENGLPFASKVSYRGKILDASKSSWDSIPKEKRLKSFLRDVLAATGTWSLLRDTVPISQIDREHVKAGTVLLAAQSVGHSWMIRHVRPTGIPELVFASVPGLQELFYRDGLPRGEAVFDKLPAGSSEAGFRSFCIEGKSCPSRAISPALSWKRHQEWRPLILRTLQIRPEPLIESIGREIRNICREAKSRASLAREAVELKKQRGACLRGSDDYNFSTNNRDARLREGFLDLWELWMTTTDVMDEARITGKNLPKILNTTLDRISQIFSDHLIDADEEIVCSVNVDSEKSLSLRDIRQLAIAGRLSPDPNESVRARWGLEPEDGVCFHTIHK